MCDRFGPVHESSIKRFKKVFISDLSSRSERRRADRDFEREAQSIMMQLTESEIVVNWMDSVMIHHYRLTVMRRLIWSLNVRDCYRLKCYAMLSDPGWAHRKTPNDRTIRVTLEISILPHMNAEAKIYPNNNGAVEKVPTIMLKFLFSLCFHLVSIRLARSSISGRGVLAYFARCFTID